MSDQLFKFRVYCDTFGTDSEVAQIFGIEKHEVEKFLKRDREVPKCTYELWDLPSDIEWRVVDIEKK